MLNNTAVQPALTAEEWRAKRKEWRGDNSATNDVGAIGVSVDGPRRDVIGRVRDYLHIRELPPHGPRGHVIAAPDGRHAIAALALHQQPFGFTREDLKALSRCADNAERWASARMYDSEDHDAHERTRTIIQRIEALLPPE